MLLVDLAVTFPFQTVFEFFLILKTIDAVRALRATGKRLRAHHPDQVVHVRHSPSIYFILKIITLLVFQSNVTAESTRHERNTGTQPFRRTKFLLVRKNFSNRHLQWNSK